MRRAQGGPPPLLRRQGSGTVWEALACSPSGIGREPIQFIAGIGKPEIPNPSGSHPQGGEAAIGPARDIVGITERTGI